MKKVLAFGEILWDIIEGKPHLGGAPLNFAAHARQCGMETSIVSALGQDDYGNKALAQIQKLGVETTYIQQNEQPTGTVPVKIVGGQPQYEITPDVAYDFIDINQIDLDDLEEFDVFYFGTLIQRSEQSKSSLYALLNSQEFEEVFYDVNLRKNSFTKEHILESLQYATILKVNDEEVDVLGPLLFDESLSFQEFCETVKEHFSNVHTIIITAGGDGCYLFAHGHLSLVSADPIVVADTVGAGDSFSAGFVTIFLKTGNALKAAEVANKIGGYVASQHGAIPAYSQEILQLIQF